MTRNRHHQRGEKNVSDGGNNTVDFFFRKTNVAEKEVTSTRHHHKQSSAAWSSCSNDGEGDEASTPSYTLMSRFGSTDHAS